MLITLNGFPPGNLTPPPVTALRNSRTAPKQLKLDCKRDKIRLYCIQSSLNETHTLNILVPTPVWWLFFEISLTIIHLSHKMVPGLEYRILNAV